MNIPKPTLNFLGIVTISVAALSYEIVLSRLFSVQQFYHFAFVIISLAVMGFAASGTILALRPKPPPLGRLSFTFSISIILVYLVLNWLPFDSFSIAWDRKQLWILLLYFLAASLPFVLSGWIVGVSLSQGGTSLHLPYAANLIGSGLGCGIALLGMQFLGGEGAIVFSVTLGLLASLLFTRNRRWRILLLPLIGVGLWFSNSIPSWMSLQLSPYKPLSIYSLIPDAELQHSMWSATTRIDIIESQGVHTFPGLSLNVSQPLPKQLALFIDGDGPYPVTNLSPDSASTQGIAEGMPGTLAYQLRPIGDALLLRSGAGLEAIFALASGASSVHISMPDPLLQSALTSPEIIHFQDALLDPRVTLHPRSDRGALQESQETFDLIVFALSEPFRPVTSGAFSLTEYYSLTIQSLQNAYDRLSPEGLLVITQWLGTPPAESAKAWSALLAAWDSKGKDPEDHLLAYRSMRTATLIASISPFREGELLLAREFFEKNGFDPIHLPDLKPHELNRFNRLPTPIYHDLYRRLRLETTETLQAYDLRIDPPTDDRPFFFHFFRWSQTPEILSQLGQQWLPFGGSGYLVLLALLVLMVVTGGILILIPTFMGRGTGTRTMTQSRDLLYFIGIGAGYLMVEIALLQRFTLLFDRPPFALAAVLFSMLLSSGVGSLFVPRLSLKPTLSLLILYLVGLSFTLHPLIEQALHWGLLAQLLLTMVALAPAGFLMGIPFARGLAKLQRDQEGAVAWAWAVNGAASGISGVLAVMISLDLGIRATLLVGTLAYLLALLVHLQRPVKTPSSLKIEL